MHGRVALAVEALRDDVETIRDWKLLDTLLLYRRQSGYSGKFNTKTEEQNQRQKRNDDLRLGGWKRLRRALAVLSRNLKTKRSLLQVQKKFIYMRSILSPSLI